jgi:hypothetical protein
MEYKNTFLVREAFKRGAARATLPHEEVADRAIALATGMWRPDKRLRFVQDEGSIGFDCVGTQFAPLRLLSSRLFEAFSAGGVTGWEALPIELSDSTGAAVTNYGLLVIVGRCGPIDNSRSVLIDRIVSGNPKGAKVWKGFYFGEETWDGSDVFSPEGSSHLIVTSKVKNILDRENATNLDLVSLADVERRSLI